MKLLPVFALLLLAPLTVAQERTNSTANPDSTAAKDGEQPFTDSIDKKGFWQATLPGGSYLVALNKITSISKHEYLLDGTLIVTEVTIDTEGDTTLRIYQITPAAQFGTLDAGRKVVEQGKNLLDRAGQRTSIDLTGMVQKQYPTTTHSKIVEFRVQQLGTLEALFGSARAAWLNGQGRKFVAKE